MWLTEVVVVVIVVVVVEVAVVVLLLFQNGSTEYTYTQENKVHNTRNKPI